MVLSVASDLHDVMFVMILLMLYGQCLSQALQAVFREQVLRRSETSQIQDPHS